jgi:hypothetical protein
MNTLKDDDVLSIAEDENKQVLFREISIWLDSYDDIFSDFDPRPYAERALSDDFIMEVRKVCREQDKLVNELKILIPAGNRNTHKENIITKRLQNYFKKNHGQYEEQYRSSWERGIFFTLFGMIMMLAASYIKTLRSDNFYLNVLLVIFEPTGWFMVWTGLDTIFNNSKQKKRELNFYRKLVKTKINFLPI